MKSDRVFVNPFQLMGLRPSNGGLRTEDLHTKPVSESLSFEDGLPIMMAKILEMTRLLSRCLFSGSKAQMKACEGWPKRFISSKRFLPDPYFLLKSAQIWPGVFSAFLSVWKGSETCLKAF